MTSLAPAKNILRGSIIGEDHAADLLKRLESGNCAATQIVILDFSEVEAVTASYLKKLLSPLLDSTTNGLKCGGIYPLVTCLSEDVREDLHSFLTEKGWLISEIRLEGSRVAFCRLLGSPEPATTHTFNLLREKQPASAYTLHESSEDKNITQTAWNNRLSTLLKLKLATRTKHGREWMYRTTFNQ